VNDLGWEIAYLIKNLLRYSILLFLGYRRGNFLFWWQASARQEKETGLVARAKRFDARLGENEKNLPKNVPQGGKKEKDTLRGR